MVAQTTSTRPAPVEPLFSGDDVLRFHETVRKVPIAEEVIRYAVRLAALSRPGQADSPDFINDWVSWGAGLRAAQYLVLGGKARALLSGNVHVTVDDIMALAHSTLRHRVLIGYRAEAERCVGGRCDRPSVGYREGAGWLMAKIQARPNVATPRRGREVRGTSSFIEPSALMRINSLELRAKVVVEGFFNGLHRSPYHGFSVEFSEYRQYTPGDDLRYLDWRVFARSDRYYIKRFEDETNLRCHIVLDMSRSMGFGSLEYNKADYARTAAATLAYFLTTQRDAVGLVTFDEQIVEFLPARYRPGHMHRLMLCLEHSLAGAETNLEAPIEQIASTVTKRGLIILISDLLAPVATLGTHLGYLRSRGHEVVLLRLLDPAEIDFTFDTPSMFFDMESGTDRFVDPQVARDAYLENFAKHADSIKTTCGSLGIDFYQFSTDRPLELTLFDFMNARLRRGRQVSRRGSMKQSTSERRGNA